MSVYVLKDYYHLLDDNKLQFEFGDIFQVKLSQTRDDKFGVVISKRLNAGEKFKPYLGATLELTETFRKVSEICSAGMIRERIDEKGKLIHNVICAEKYMTPYLSC